MKPHVVLCTPCRDGLLTTTYHAAILRLVLEGQVDAQINWLLWDDGIVVVRSRMAQCAIDMGATHAFFVDNDVSPHPRLLRRMLDCNVDFVTTPYARKMIDWSKLSGATKPQDLYRFPYIKQDDTGREGDTVPVDGTPFGCTLIKVEALKRMRAHYEKELGYLDTYGGTTVATVALFMPMIHELAPLGEDYAFCRRALAIGIQPRLYVGEHSPTDHAGTYLWRGSTSSPA